MANADDNNEMCVTENIDVDEYLPPVSAKSDKNRDMSELDAILVDELTGIKDNTAKKGTKKKRPKSVNKNVRKIPVPFHRLAPLKENWMKIFAPVVEHLKVQIRFNTHARQVELRAGPETTDSSLIQKGADFVRAFVVGFDVEDALALLRLEDLFVESFEIKDVKTLKGDHVSRAIGRLAGKGGRTKFTIENVTKTRVVLADTKIHILGSYQNIALARRAICNLILGSPPSKVYGNLRSVASRISERL